MSDPLNEAIFVPSLAKYYDVGDHTAVDLTTKYSDLTEYDPHKIMVEILETDYGKEWNNYSVMNFRIKLLRKWSIYFWRVGIFMLSISLSSIIVYTMRPDDVSSRYDVLITLLLTVIAFQFVVTSYLPNISYLTLLDKYILFCFAFLILNMIIIAILSIIELENGYYQEIELYSALSVLSLFVISNTYFALKMSAARTYEIAKADLDCFDMWKNGYINNNQVGGELNALKDNIRLSKNTKSLLDGQRFRDFVETEGKAKN